MFNFYFLKSPSSNCATGKLFIVAGSDESQAKRDERRRVKQHAPVEQAGGRELQERERRAEKLK